MGALAEAFVAYAQPLLDQTDGSEEQLNKAFAISQLCYNLGKQATRGPAGHNARRNEAISRDG